MLKRIIFGAVMIAAFVGLLIAAEPTGGLSIVGLVVILVPLAFREIGRLAAAAGARLLSVSGVVATLGIALWPYLRWLAATRTSVQTGGELSAALDPLAGVGLLMLLVFAEQMIRFRTADAFRQIAATLLAVVYLGVGLAAMTMFYLEMGAAGLVLFIAAVKCTDIGAYFTGSAVGKHKLIPWLSPGKSWEGLGGGLAAGAIAAVIVTLAMGAEGLGIWQAAVFGLIVGLAGQFGDLCESLLKRSAQVKDSGAVVPEFGGVLDILDSPLLSAPIAYLAIRLLLLA